MRILLVSGSLRAGSLNTRLLRLASEEAPEHLELAWLEGLREVPPFDADEEQLGDEAVTALRDAIAGADAVLVATPEYNGSVPGVLKNAVDWASRPTGAGALAGVPVAVIGASPGRFGGVWGQAELKKVLGIAGARVVDVELAVPKAADALEEPAEELRDRLRNVLAALEDAAGERTPAAA
jgi:chromate reductase